MRQYPLRRREGIDDWPWLDCRRLDQLPVALEARKIDDADQPPLYPLDPHRDRVIGESIDASKGCQIFDGSPVWLICRHDTSGRLDCFCLREC